jgi:predicted porin
VAGAVLSLSAISANAGIIIPAGEWTLDISGNVNTFATWTRQSGDLDLGNAPLGLSNSTGRKTESNITTGLLPNYLSVSGTTRQNDLDVSFTISINPGSSTQTSLDQNAHQENRQAFLTFGDKSWGSVKVGKDLGIFASDALLNDMTLLGVGAGAGGLAGNTTTLGRIGTGFIYADWKSQIAYTTPNFNGFQATVGITQAFNAAEGAIYSGYSDGRGGASPAYEGKASYSFAANDMTGKVWVSGITQELKNINDDSTRSLTAYAGDIGANVNVAGFGLTGYYYTGEGIGQTGQFRGGVSAFGEKRDSEGGYIQATYVLPTKTKIGLSWGESVIYAKGLERDVAKDLTDSMWVAGVYHPLTKNLNLVAEYSSSERELAFADNSTARGRAHTGSLGAILFF